MRQPLVSSGGRGCYRRHAFKREIARKGKGSLVNLGRAYNESFEAWIEDGALHIRYGKVSTGCSCPAARRQSCQCAWT